MAGKTPQGVSIPLPTPKPAPKPTAAEIAAAKKAAADKAAAAKKAAEAAAAAAAAQAKKDAKIISGTTATTTPSSSGLNNFAPVGYNSTMAAAMPGGLGAPKFGAFESDTSSGAVKLPVGSGSNTSDGSNAGSAGGAGGGGGGGGDGGGGGGGSNPADDLAAQAAAAARVDAFKLLESIFTGYGLAELVPSIRELMQGVKDPVTGKVTQVGPNEAVLLLKTDPRYNKPYLARFAGNETRRAAGLNVYTEADYLAHEDEYSALFEQYGQKSFATKKEFANLIGSDISKTELNSRLDLAVLQVQNADPEIKKTLQQFYPGISDTDLVSYFLKPEETLPQLQQKVTAAQIGTAATEQGLKTSVGSAEELAKYGVTQQTAQTGYAKIGEVLPAATKLSTIYGEAQVGYDQATAEQEVFKGLASAQRKRQQLQQLEQAQFSGRSGINQQINPLGKGLQGSF